MVPLNNPHCQAKIACNCNQAMSLADEHGGGPTMPPAAESLHDLHPPNHIFTKNV